MPPTAWQFRDAGGFLRRSATLREADKSALAALSALIDDADVKREGMAATSLDIAIGKFMAASHQLSPYEALVDLATGFEATLAGVKNEGEGLTLRLRNRAAALLATDADPARAVFADVGLLDGLRSALVHGGQIKQSELRRDLRKISTMPADETAAAFGIAIGRAADRMRDLLRRALLARLCLTVEPDALWPFTGEPPCRRRTLRRRHAPTLERAMARAAHRTRAVARAVPSSPAADFFTAQERDDNAPNAQDAIDEPAP